AVPGRGRRRPCRSTARGGLLGARKEAVLGSRRLGLLDRQGGPLADPKALRTRSGLEEAAAVDAKGKTPDHPQTARRRLLHLGRRATRARRKRARPRAKRPGLRCAPRAGVAPLSRRRAPSHRQHCRRTRDQTRRDRSKKLALLRLRRPRYCRRQPAELVASAKLHDIDAEQYLAELIHVMPYWPRQRYLELAPFRWKHTRARLDPAELQREIGPITVPPPLADSAEQAPSS